jgi:hypothetical protein
MNSRPDRWQVIQIRLDKPLGPMTGLENAAGAYLVFWWKDIPLGHVGIPAREFPLNEAELQRVVSRAIAPAVGNYSLESGFKAPLPALALQQQRPAFHIPPPARIARCSPSPAGGSGDQNSANDP